MNEQGNIIARYQLEKAGPGSNMLDTEKTTVICKVAQWKTFLQI